MGLGRYFVQSNFTFLENASKGPYCLDEILVNGRKKKKKKEFKSSHMLQH